MHHPVARFPPVGSDVFVASGRIRYASLTPAGGTRCPDEEAFGIVKSVSVGHIWRAGRGSSRARPDIYRVTIGPARSI